MNPITQVALASSHSLAGQILNDQLDANHADAVGSQSSGYPLTPTAEVGVAPGAGIIAGPDGVLEIPRNIPSRVLIVAADIETRESKIPPRISLIRLGNTGGYRHAVLARTAGVAQRQPVN